MVLLRVLWKTHGWCEIPLKCQGEGRGDAVVAYCADHGESPGGLTFVLNLVPLSKLMKGTA